jgi:hypothetical protein
MFIRTHFINEQLVIDIEKNNKEKYNRRREHVAIVRHLPSILPFIKKYVSQGGIEQVLMVHYEEKKKKENSKWKHITIFHIYQIEKIEITNNKEKKNEITTIFCICVFEFLLSVNNSFVDHIQMHVVVVV